MAEWLRRGLQILARRFDSGSGLHAVCGANFCLTDCCENGANWRDTRYGWPNYSVSDFAIWGDKSPKLTQSLCGEFSSDGFVFAHR